MKETATCNTDRYPGNSFSQGFTLVEILVAIALFTILMAVMISTFTGTLGINRKSQMRLNSVTTAQQTMETIKAQWGVPRPASGAPEEMVDAFITSSNRYANACVKLSSALPSGVTVTVQGLDKRGGNATTATALSVKTGTSECAARGTDVPAMRRVTVQAKDATGKTVNLVLDIVDPERL